MLSENYTTNTTSTDCPVIWFWPQEQEQANIDLPRATACVSYRMKHFLSVITWKWQLKIYCKIYERMQRAESDIQIHHMEII